MTETPDGRDLPMAAAARWYAGPLPTFDDLRSEAYRLLTEARTVLCSDWRAGTNPSDEEVNAKFDAEDAVHAAITALQRAGVGR